MPTVSEAAVAGPSETRAAGAAVETRSLRHSFGELEVLGGLDLTIARHEVVGLVGPSGCGKSTLLEIVAGLRDPAGGSVAVGGDAGARGRLAHSAYMPQRDLLLPWLSAIDNAAIALRNRGSSRARARAAAATLFERFGLAGFEAAHPHELSGGMRQRVAFLRTLLAGKALLLLDEPFAGLDAITRGEMQEWLAEALSAEARTTVLVTHDVEEALYLCDRVCVLSARPGRIVEELASPAPRAAPRRAAITSGQFSAARERALVALQRGRA
jgi:NitT/TauT family transport system ATP-binding protein